MMNLMAKVENGERLNREETIALRLIQEATVHAGFKYDSFEKAIDVLNKEASALFQDKNFTLGARVKKAATNVELASLWIGYKIDEDNEKVKEISPIFNSLKAIPREQSSREISLAITALEESMLWLSK